MDLFLEIMNFIFQQINNDKLLETLNQNDIIYLKNANIKLPIHKIIAFKSNFIKLLKSALDKSFFKTSFVSKSEYGSIRMRR